MKSFLRLLLVTILGAQPLFAEDGNVRLAVPPELEKTGFMQYLVPRFSLKTSVRIDRVSQDAAAEMQLGAEGTPVFSGSGATYALSHNGDPRAVRFLDWLTSDVGQRTITSYSDADGVVFTLPTEAKEEDVATVYDGDAAMGETLSLEKCGRCHVVNETNRMNAIGSTPSFALLRTFDDWEIRFTTFHLLKPHPSFTQVIGVTEAFDPLRPPSIVPLTMTLDDLDAILAYVSGIEPANLGAPLQLQ